MTLIEPAEPATANRGAAWRTRAIVGAYAVASILVAIGAARSAAAPGDYTQQQAAAGHQVFSRHCAKCHGGNLQGGAGPPLAGPKFKSNLEYSKMSAQQLFAFIKTQMPNNAPGSLSKKQYLQDLAYILSKNDYPQGPKRLSEKTLPGVKLLPYPDKGGSHGKAGTQSHS